MGIEAGTALAVSGGLGAWSACALALTRRAEGRVAGCPCPLRWPESCATLVLAACAPLLAAAPGDAAARGIACIALCAAAGADARTGYLFDGVLLPAAALTAAVACAGGNATAAAAGVLFLAGPLGVLVAGSRGAWMGLGDAKAAYVIGAAFGAAAGALALAAACASGLLWVALSSRGAVERKRAIAFGPHLAAGAVAALIAGDPLLRWVAEAGR